MHQTGTTAGTKRMLTTVAMATPWLAAAGGGFAADPAAPAKAAETQAAVDGTAVLDHSTLWRFWCVTDPARVRKPDGKLAFFNLGGGHQWGTEVSEARYPALTGDWTAPVFDDSAWPRECLPQPSIPESAPASESQEAADNPIDVVGTCLRARVGTFWAHRTTRAVLFPGPDVAVGTERFEMVREGLELCEARLFIQHAAFKKQLSPELQKRVEAYVAARHNDVSGGASMIRYMQVEEDAKLLDLAGEVAKELAGKK